MYMVIMFSLLMIRSVPKIQKLALKVKMKVFPLDNRIIFLMAKVIKSVGGTVITSSRGRGIIIWKETERVDVLVHLKYINWDLVRLYHSNHWKKQR
jgi:hypothetical protein